MAKSDLAQIVSSEALYVDSGQRAALSLIHI